MRNSAAASLSVSIRELPSVHAACISYTASDEQHDLHNEIGDCFRHVQAWVREHGYDPFATLTIGVPALVGGRLSSYECCIEVPEDVQGGSSGVGVKELPGGRYAVVSIEKDPAIIGDAIGRFYQEYVPQNALKIDGRRPTYEIYYASMMEYCVPLL
jgi:DNA gyrase inhibitor GyrI